jgi:hypothetical protein
MEKFCITTVPNSVKNGGRPGSISALTAQNNESFSHHIDQKTPIEGYKGMSSGCIHPQKIEKTIGFLKSGGHYPEHNDADHPFHVRATHLGGDLSAIFAAKREWDIKKGRSEKWDSWPENIPDERVFICTEPMPNEESTHPDPSGSWRFRWFAEPYRPFHRVHFS